MNTKIRVTRVGGALLVLALAGTLWLSSAATAAVTPYVVQGAYFRLFYNPDVATYHSIAGQLYTLKAQNTWDPAFLVALKVLQVSDASFKNNPTTHVDGRLTVWLYYEKSNTLGAYNRSLRRIYLNTKIWNSKDPSGSMKQFAMVFAHEGSHAAFYRTIGFVPDNWKGSETSLRFLTEAFAWYTHACVYTHQWSYAYLQTQLRNFYASRWGLAAKPGWGQIWQAYSTTSEYSGVCRYYFAAFGWYVASTGKAGALLSRIRYEYAHYTGASIATTLRNPYNGETFTGYSTTVTARAFLAVYGVFANEDYSVYTISAQWNSDGSLAWKYYYQTVYARFLAFVKCLPVPIVPRAYPDFKIQPL